MVVNPHNSPKQPEVWIPVVLESAPGSDSVLQFIDLFPCRLHGMAHVLQVNIDSQPLKLAVIFL